MISKLSEKAAEKLLVQDNLSQEDRELYVYGFFILFSKIFFFFLTVVYGLLIGNIVESILFYAIFTVIRGYAGGIHASNEKTCVFFTSLSLFFCIVAMKLCSDYFLIPVLLTLLFLGAICILILSPLDTEAKRLTKEEKKEFRKKSLFFTIFTLFVALTATGLGKVRILSPCVFGFFLESILLLLGEISNRMRKKAE